MELPAEPALEVDLRRDEGQRPDDQRKQHAGDALADVLAMSTSLQRIPGAHPGEEHDDRHDPRRGEQHDFAGNPASLCVRDVPFVPRIEDLGDVHHEDDGDCPHANGVDVSQAVVSRIGDEPRGRRRRVTPAQSFRRPLLGGFPTERGAINRQHSPCVDSSKGTSPASPPSTFR